ncbi:hypothetical protein [Microbacterium aquimaris]|uniref:Uncharacterized protein n=1 Tax=Microbacterium aquimaris TaxID=459816 RepID=A0ABU5N8F7_9MICO|nr:hypothetical protein [Microbacterium aquimaris]MDZ8162349.1 hypothetical protein [Microbacterium aquimaris]
MNTKSIETRPAFPSASTIGVTEMLNAAATLELDADGLGLMFGQESPLEDGRPGYELPLGLAGKAFLDLDDTGVWQLGIDFRDQITFEQFQAATILIALAQYWAEKYDQ